MSLLLEYPSYLTNLGKGQYPWTYPGGEVGIRIPAGTTITKCTARMQNAQDIIQFIMASRGREEGPFQDVLIPYLPYARQDRVAVPGDPNAINVFADLLRESLVRRVFTIDAHSPESEKAFLTRGISFHSISPLPYIREYILSVVALGVRVALVAPDKGSREKTEQYHRALVMDDNLRLSGVVMGGIVYCDKVRDPTTGKISGFSAKVYDRDGNAVAFNPDEWADVQFVIVDDICDGGGTFRGIREQVFKPSNTVHLWTTHGIYSGLGGVSALSDTFNTVGSTDSFKNQEAESTADGLHYIRVKI